MSADLAGPAVHEAADLLYEVAMYINDVGADEMEFDDMANALAARLIPVADAMLREVRSND